MPTLISGKLNGKNGTSLVYLWMPRIFLFLQFFVLCFVVARSFEEKFQVNSLRKAVKFAAFIVVNRAY